MLSEGLRAIPQWTLHTQLWVLSAAWSGVPAHILSFYRVTSEKKEEGN